MFSPGKKNWIKKFFSLVDRNEIHLQVNLSSETDNVEEQIREVCEHTGILYGVPNQNLYAQNLVDSATRNEKLILLLFESFLFIDQKHQGENFTQDDFLHRLSSFYQINTTNTSRTWYGASVKPEVIKIEQLLSDRIKVHSSYSDRNFWFNHLTNGFLFLDLILFHESYSSGPIKAQERYNQWVESVLILMSYLPYNHPAEKVHFDTTMFKNLLLSAELPEQQVQHIKKGALSSEQYSEALNTVLEVPLLSLFTFHFTLILFHSYPSNSFVKGSFLFEFGEAIGLSEEQITEVFWECRKSLSDHSNEFYHLVSESESKILTTHLTRKYHRILGRNKDRLIQELKESKELVYLVRQSALRELTPEEKEKVRTQSLDLMKTVPSIGIYLLPGGALWLPLVLKLIPDLLPSAFKENEVEEKK
ncbi:MAG: LETM1 domain-containing protein [Crocinitomicaceae bacterium]|jgi:hypothetical protein|nr:LETM1 domain-containing protein [Crocinitomicaceae bacterium]